MLQNISYRYKAPLSLSLVILLTAVVVSITLIGRAYQDAKQDLVGNALSLAKVLAATLRPALLHDDLWLAYETIMTPLQAASSMRENSEASVATIIILDANQRIYVSTQPERFALFGSLGAIDRGYADLESNVAEHNQVTQLTEDKGGHGRIFLSLPIPAEDGTSLGTLILVYPKSIFLPRFYKSIQQVIFSVLLVLIILLPLGWIAGKKLTDPLSHLADCMARVGRESPTTIQCDLYAGKDEVGLLSNRFKQMLDELKEKHALEQEMLASDRLAAIGKLTAGIAHEINNPLGGMLNAINTFKRHGTPDALAGKTFSLLERGLQQIRETVSALLVEAKVESHALTPQDIEDTRTLVQADVQRKGIQFDWANELAEPIALPSTQIRQILLNLLLNAVQATQDQGAIKCAVSHSEDRLKLTVQNQGEPINADAMAHLFEPFYASHSGGNGLGLWVTYQLVEQLGGEITAESEHDRTSFHVTLPVSA